MKKTTGFSFVELMVGIIVVAAVSVTALEFLVHCQRLVLVPRLRLMAVNFARETMEGLYQQPYIELTTPSAAELELPTGGEIGVLRDRYGGTRNCTITDVDNYKVITVTVSWQR